MLRWFGVIDVTYTQCYHTNDITQQRFLVHTGTRVLALSLGLPLGGLLYVHWAMHVITTRSRDI